MTDVSPGWPVPGVTAAPQVGTFVLVEDESLKAYLKGITVPDRVDAARPVQSWFGMPDEEIRGQSYPFLTIDLIGMREDVERVQNRYAEPSYYPQGIQPSDDQFSVRTFFPTPMDLSYQVTAYSRLPRHDRALLSQISMNYLHPRLGQMGCVDGLNRRIVYRDFAKRDGLDENGKRQFRNIWTVSVMTEFFYGPLDVTPRARTVNIETGSYSLTEKNVLPVVRPL